MERWRRLAPAPRSRNGQNPIEALSDRVIALIITIMVLELKVPHGGGFDVLLPLAPILGSYVLSFIYVGIYWNKLQYAKYPHFAGMANKWLNYQHKFA